MKEIILIKNGELALKGLNRSTFEDVLVKNLKYRLKKCGQFEIKKSQSTITVEPVSDDFDFSSAIKSVSRVFGIAAFSRALAVEKDMDEIIKYGVDYLADALKGVKTFKVESKRSDKKFPLNSLEISAEFGGALLEKYHHLKVDVHNPEAVVVVEIRDKYAFIRCGQQKGAGGMPVGTGGRAEILISGGIDSPVAAWMIAKRGIQLSAVHFASPPYTSLRAEQKVIKLLSKVAAYSGPIALDIIPFTEIQEEIADKCKEEYFTLIMRRFMMKIAEKMAEREHALALITGESVGQVASQTLPALCVTDRVVTMPVLRPLIGMDKDEIIDISRKIDTFDISIEPYEDCCTVFTPKHPKTRPELAKVEEAESALDIDGLIERAIEGRRFMLVE
ncbi:MAG: tRNA 4-thiouridine(8) synthase ThiI [Ruminococcaceae bacterium]|nr:tRNA 4-thiouridine(8) synthase ThiI [Oscillospiraceae bacterium]